MASGRLSKKELRNKVLKTRNKEKEELCRHFRRASFDERNKEDAADRAACRSMSDEGPDPSKGSHCKLHPKVAADNKDKDL